MEVMKRSTRREKRIMSLCFFPQRYKVMVEFSGIFIRIFLPGVYLMFNNLSAKEGVTIGFTVQITLQHTSDT